jgi:hypothetical protein
MSTRPTAKFTSSSEHASCPVFTHSTDLQPGELSNGGWQVIRNTDGLLAVFFTVDSAASLLPTTSRKEISLRLVSLPIWGAS